LDHTNVDQSVFSRAIRNADRDAVERELREHLTDNNDVLITLPTIPKPVEDRNQVFINTDDGLKEFRDISDFRKAVYNEEWRASQVNIYIKDADDTEGISINTVKNALQIPT
jgi:hypothetical protein